MEKDPIIDQKNEDLPNNKRRCLSVDETEEKQVTTKDSEQPKSLFYDENGQQISKRRHKKLKKLENWQLKKQELRIKEREKYKQKRLDAKANGLPTRNGPSRKELKRNKIDSSKCNVTVAVDLSFDELMQERDISKLVKQLLRVYTINRRSLTPINLYFTGILEGNRTHEILKKNDGYQNWDVIQRKESYLEVFDKQKLVYLTAESDNVLTTLNKDDVYVIGGLVDHNHNKGHCFEIACKMGLRHARLPLSENIIIKTRTVLTIFHGK